VFFDDLAKNYDALVSFGIKKQDAYYFLPSYEWYNDTISAWTKECGLQLINFTPGTRSAADYTYPEMKSYRPSNAIYESIITYEITNITGLNGFILLVHIGTDPRRTDKFYLLLPSLIDELKEKGYQFVRIDELLGD
jgi:endoglucanase